MINRLLASSRHVSVVSLFYAGAAFVLFATGVLDPSTNNFVRVFIAGFLATLVVVITVIFILYLGPAQQTRGDNRLLPNHVAKVTLASILTITWICIELWARTGGGHFGPPWSLIYAGFAGVLWLWALTDVLRFEQLVVKQKTRAHNNG